MLLSFRVKDIASIMKVTLLLIATVALQFNPSQAWYDEVDQSVGSPWGSGQSGRGPSNVDPSQGWYDEDAEDEEEFVGFGFSRRPSRIRPRRPSRIRRGGRSGSRGGRSETKCMFLGGQCPFDGKQCCQGKPPWSHSYKVECINGRCTKKAKCMFLGGQCRGGKRCCQGRPPWSNQYKVECINGRCTKKAK